MKHTLMKISDTKISLSVSLGVEELKHAKDHAVKALAPKVRVAGFRPGKVPAAVAEKNIDTSALASEAIEHAINDALNEIVKTEDIRVLDRPSVELGEFKPYESLEFTAVIDILPAVTLGDYKKLTAKKEKIVVGKKDIVEVLTRMRQGFAEKKTVQRAVKDGDEVIIDFVGHDVNGELVAGAAGSDYPLLVGSHTFIPGFEEGIIGHVPGDTFELSLSFPKDYHSETLKGVNVVFKIDLKAVSEVTLPEVDDDFAKRAGPFQTAKELHADIENEIKTQKDRVADDNYKDALLGELVEKSKVPVPEILVDDQMKSIEQDSMQNLMYRGITPEQYIESQGFTDREQWREKEFRSLAIRRVSSGLVLAELSKVEKIEVSQAELEARLSEMKQQYPDPKTQQQMDTPDSRRDIANRVLTEKTIARLVEINTK